MADTWFGSKPTLPTVLSGPGPVAAVAMDTFSRKLPWEMQRGHVLDAPHISLDPSAERPLSSAMGSKTGHTLNNNNDDVKITYFLFPEAFN
jgi:hypothetical protein